MSEDAWTHRRFFELLAELSPLRIVSQTGASVFEAILSFGGFGIAGGHMNAITPSYHWHVDLGSFSAVRSRDETHARSGRRVLFFELFAELPAGAEGAPFLAICVHRGKGEEFAPERERAFLRAHRTLGAGAPVVAGGDA